MSSIVPELSCIANAYYTLAVLRAQASCSCAHCRAGLLLSLPSGEQHVSSRTSLHLWQHRRDAEVPKRREAARCGLTSQLIHCPAQSSRTPRVKGTGTAMHAWC